ncbi:hypothetical protein D3C75_696620 [compost metagenome]
MRYSRICRSKFGWLPSPKRTASSDVTINPAPCNLTPGELIPRQLFSCFAPATFAPIFKSANRRPCCSCKLTSTSSWLCSLVYSSRTCSSRPSCSSAAPTVMAIRTCAPSPASTQGWSGIAKARNRGFLASSCVCTTRRLNVCLMLLVVMNPKRFALSARTASAAICHQCMTKSADSGTSDQVLRTAST